MDGQYTSERLKEIAMGTMFIDHAAVALIYGGGLDSVNPMLGNIGLAMRLIGRMAFPLYAFLLVQGFLHTKDWKRYIGRTFIFAIISEIPFDLVLSGQVWDLKEQNTMVTMCIGLLCMRGIAAFESGFSDDSIKKTQCIFNRFVKVLMIGMIILLSMLTAEALHADYGAYGVLLISAFYILRYRMVEQMGVVCFLLLFMYDFSLYAPASWIAFFFINRYNGERGRKLGMLSYVFYPAHLAALSLAAKLLVRI